jgi:hypothetical protein
MTMIAVNCTNEQLRQALDSVNVRYQGNIKFRKIRAKGKWIDFTLGVKISKGPGAWRDDLEKQFPRACYHAQGHFLQELFKYAPEAEVFSEFIGTWITRNGGNWQDKNIGSTMRPLMFSQACDCNKNLQEAVDKLISGRIQFRTLSKAMTMNCPLCIYDPGHYRDDGTCRCYDKEQQAKTTTKKKV